MGHRQMKMGTCNNLNDMGMVKTVEMVLSIIIIILGIILSSQITSYKASVVLEGKTPLEERAHKIASVLIEASELHSYLCSEYSQGRDINLLRSKLEDLTADGIAVNLTVVLETVGQKIPKLNIVVGSYDRSRAFTTDFSVICTYGFGDNLSSLLPILKDTSLPPSASRRIVRIYLGVSMG